MIKPFLPTPTVLVHTPENRAIIYPLSLAINEQGYTRYTFGMFSNSPDTVKVTFRCTEKMHNVFYDRFGDVMMTAEDDNYFRVTVPVAVSPQFFGWVLGLGKNVQIIGPEEVRTQMREYLAGISEYYQAPLTT